MRLITDFERVQTNVSHSNFLSSKMPKLEYFFEDCVEVEKKWMEIWQKWYHVFPRRVQKDETPFKNTQGARNRHILRGNSNKLRIPQKNLVFGWISKSDIRGGYEENPRN